MSNPLFEINSYPDFISIHVTKEVYDLAKTINPEWASEGMSGYDVDEFINAALTEKTLGEIKTDPEFGGWYGYYEPGVKGQVQELDIHKAQGWAVRATKDILAYIPRRMREEADRLESDLLTRYEGVLGATLEVKSN